MFESIGKLDEAFLREAWWALFGRRNKRVSLLFLLTVLVMLGFVLYAGIRELVWLPFAMAAVFLLVDVWHIFRQRKLSLERMREVNGRPETRITTRFLEDGVQQHNLDTGGTAKLAYDALDRLYETDSYLLLHTKSDQVAVAFKANGLDRDGLIAFLKTRPTRIKWKE